MTEQTPDQRQGAKVDDMLAQLSADRGAPPSDGLMARVLADAAAEQATRTSEPRQGLANALAEMLGGWRGFGGLALASCTGLFLGIAQPAGFETVSAALGGDALEVGLGLTFAELGLEDAQ